VKIGYLDQEQESLDLSQSVLDAYREESALPEEKLISDLIRMGYLCTKMYANPSRISIVTPQISNCTRLIAHGANVLLLDNPPTMSVLTSSRNWKKRCWIFPAPSWQSPTTGVLSNALLIKFGN
jgi:hypothetical protein